MDNSRVKKGGVQSDLLDFNSYGGNQNQKQKSQNKSNAQNSLNLFGDQEDDILIDLNYDTDKNKQKKSSKMQNYNTNFDDDYEEPKEQTSLLSQAPSNYQAPNVALSI